MSAEDQVEQRQQKRTHIRPGDTRTRFRSFLPGSPSGGLLSLRFQNGLVHIAIAHQYMVPGLEMHIPLPNVQLSGGYLRRICRMDTTLWDLSVVPEDPSP